MASEPLDQARERLRPFVEAAQGFSGWGFSRYGNARVLDADKPWNYDNRVRELVAKATSVLDIGTGGGERLSRYLRDFKGRAVATEAWDVNAPLATEKLRPLGVNVLWCDDEAMPLAESTFDLVINRHAALEPADVGRILRPGGIFLTEQISKSHWGELKSFFPRATVAEGENHYFSYLVGLRAAGLESSTRGSIPDSLLILI
jgi:SAM-dependent methyltransferase